MVKYSGRWYNIHKYHELQALERCIARLWYKLEISVRVSRAR